jgi:hypothetical protein
MSIHRASLRFTVGLVGGVLALGSLGACASEAKVPSVAFPSASEPPVREVTLPPVSTYTGYAPPLGVVSARISGMSANATMSFKMTPMTFTVTIANSSSFTFKDLEPLVVLGQCTCNPANADAVPYEYLEVWDETGKLWRPVTYSEVGADQTFSYGKQLAPQTLGPNASLSFRYRLYLGKAPKETGLVNGVGSLNFYVLQLPNHTRVKVDTSPDASLALTYAVG